MKTISDLREEVSTILTGMDLDQVPDLYGSFERAVSTFIQKADVLEASGREPIMLYDGVTDYPAPDSIFGGALIDVRPQGVVRQNWDTVQKMPIERFDRTKWWKTPSGYNVTFETRTTELIMRISQNFAKQKVQIDGMSDTDGWVIGGFGSGLAQDTTVFYHQPASLRFNAAVGQAYLIKDPLDQTLNLSDYEGVGVVFLALYLPDAATISAIELRLGSSSSDFVQVVETEGFLSPLYSNEFQLVAFDLAGATVNGTPDFSAIDFVEIDITVATTAQVNIRYGDLFISLPSANEILFYSPNVFIPSGGTTPQLDISSDDDTIIFRPASYNIYVQEAAREIAKNQGGSIASGLIASIDLVLEGAGDRKLGLYQAYRGDNPSNEIRETGNWYYD